MAIRLRRIQETRQRKGQPAQTGQPPETKVSTPSRMPTQGDYTTVSTRPHPYPPPWGEGINTPLPKTLTQPSPEGRGGFEIGERGRGEGGAVMGTPGEFPLSRALAHLLNRHIGILSIGYRAGQPPVIEVENGHHARRLHGEHTGRQRREGQTLDRFETALFGCTVFWLADPVHPRQPVRGLA